MSNFLVKVGTVLYWLGGKMLDIFLGIVVALIAVIWWLILLSIKDEDFREERDD